MYRLEHFVLVYFRKFLFTAPRNLWQGSEEEFCISFHDDDDEIKADYQVTLASKDKTFTSVIGNGTANGLYTFIRMPSSTRSRVYRF